MIFFDLFVKSSFLSECYFIQYSTSYTEFKHNLKSEFVYTLCDSDNNLIFDANLHIMCFEDYFACVHFIRKHNLSYDKIKTRADHLYSIVCLHPHIGIIFKKKTPYHFGSIFRSIMSMRKLSL